MKFRKPLCDKCNLDRDCCCQDNQKDTDSCGMENILAYNRDYNKCLKAGRTERDPETDEFYYLK